MESRNQEEPIFEIIHTIRKHFKTTDNLHQCDQTLTLHVVRWTIVYYDKMEEMG